jgi:hypothetical protein
LNGVLAAGVSPGANGTYAPPAGGDYLAFGSNGGVPYSAPPFAGSGNGSQIVAGSINYPFAPAPASSTTTTVLLPSASTVDGRVVTTSHSATSDYAGIYATDTSGVYVGIVPKTAG